MSLIWNPCLRLLCEKIFRLIFYLSVESLLYACVILTKKEGNEKITNSVAKLMMKVCVFLFDFYDIIMINCFSNVYLMLILLNYWNNTKEKNGDTITHDGLEGMSTPLPKVNEAVGREGDDYKMVRNSNDKGLCSVDFFFSYESWTVPLSVLGS